MAESKMSSTELLPEVQNVIVKRLQNRRIEGMEQRVRKNIFLFGNPGAGKSTLVNSLIMALNEDGYAEYALHGYRGIGGIGGGGRISEAFRSYDVLDCASLLLPAHADVFRPYLFDTMGLANDCDHNIKEIVKGIVSGAFPPNTLMSKLMNMKKHDKIEEAYNLNCPEKWDPEIWADVCLFVMSPLEEPPENLMEAVYDATKRHLFEVPVILVITKADIIGEQGQEDFQRRKARAMQRLGLEGTDERVFMLTNYCSKVTLERDREMDKTLCKLWKTVLAREYHRRENIAPEKPSKSSCVIF